MLLNIETKGGTRGVIVIVLENGYGDSFSNPRRGS